MIPETAAGTRPQSPLSKLTWPALEACNLKGLAHQGAPSNNVGDNVGCLPVSLPAFFSSQRKRTPAELLILESTVDLAERLPRRWVSNSAPTVQTDPAAPAAAGAWSEAAGPACQPPAPLAPFVLFSLNWEEAQRQAREGQSQFAGSEVEEREGPNRSPRS